MGRWNFYVVHIDETGTEDVSGPWPSFKAAEQVRQDQYGDLLDEYDVRSRRENERAQPA